MTDSDSDVLDGAEEMLRRIAATACLDLDATEAAAIVAELDRLRSQIQEMAQRATDLVRERDEALAAREADSDRLHWVAYNLLESHWRGTIGEPPTWSLAPRARHVAAKLRGNTLTEAIDAAAAKEKP